MLIDHLIPEQTFWFFLKEFSELYSKLFHFPGRCLFLVAVDKIFVLQREYLVLNIFFVTKGLENR